MAASHTGGDDSLGDTGCDGPFDNGGDRVHGANDLGLELWGNVELDLLEEVLRSTEAADDKNILNKTQLAQVLQCRVSRECLLGGFCSGLEWR